MSDISTEIFARFRSKNRVINRDWLVFTAENWIIEASKYESSILRKYWFEEIGDIEVTEKKVTIRKPVNKPKKKKNEDNKKDS